MFGVVWLRAVDSGQKIEIPPGKTTVGRGSLLAVADKHVSRSHAVLEVLDGSLTVLPIHTNPTFYKPKGKTKFVNLKKNEPKKLQDGDFISLLPNKYIFEVVYAKSAESEVAVKNPGAEEATADDYRKPLTVEVCDKEAGQIDDEHRHTDKASLHVGHKKKGESVLDELMDYEPSSSATSFPGSFMGQEMKEPGNEATSSATAMTPDITEAGTSSRQPTSLHEEPSTSLIKSQDTSDSSTSLQSKAKPNVEAASPLQKTRKLPTWMLEPTAKATSKGKKKMTAEKMKTEVEENNNKPKRAKQSSKTKSAKTGDEGGDNGTPKKTARKTKGALDSDEEASEIKDSDTASPQRKRGRTHGAKRQDIDSDNDDVVASTASNEERACSLKEESSGEENGNEGEKILPTCPYGANCYRKNPVHFQEYSHASKEADSDLDSDDNRPECPYGTSCYRRNAQHKKDFKHTADSDRPKRKSARKTAKKSVLEGDSDDSGSPNTYDYNDSFLTDSESSSYGEESGDSDWKPDAKVGEEEEDGEEEDVNELLSEARGFLRNKKLTKPV